MNSKLILLELNELTPVLMEKFIAQGLLPNFKALRDQSECYISDAEQEPPALEPWIQWVTLHTGLSFAEHGVFDLGDGQRFLAPRLWDRVAEHGGRALVFGSMNASFQPQHRDKINLVPDPWSISLKPSPAGLYDDFYSFLRTYVHEYTSEQPPLDARAHARFVAFMVRRGLSMKTITDAITQLMIEKVGAPKWRRAAILDRLFWDAFRSEWKRLQPNLATVFLNSTAHLQHYYWRDMEPEKFGLKPDAANKAGDAIIFGYQRMDQIVGECLEMAGQNVYIALCSALGQQPLTKYDQQGGKLVFKLRDPKILLHFSGYRGAYHYSPVMAEQFHLILNSEDTAREAHEKLAALQHDQKPVMDIRRDGCEIFGGCGLIQQPAESAMISTPYSNTTLPFSALFYPVDTLKSGMHHPDGIFWLSGPDITPKQDAGRIPLTRVGDMMLDKANLSATSKILA